MIDSVYVNQFVATLVDNLLKYFTQSLP